VRRKATTAPKLG